MSFTEGARPITLEASTDLSTKQHYGMKVDSNGQAAVAGAGEFAIGVLVNKPGAQYRPAEIQISGVCECKAAGVIAPGAFVTFDASGLATTATKGKTDTSDGGAAADPLLGSNVFGIALNKTNTAANDIFPVLITRSGSVPTTPS